MLSRWMTLFTLTLIDTRTSYTIICSNLRYREVNFWNVNCSFIGDFTAQVQNSNEIQLFDTFDVALSISFFPFLVLLFVEIYFNQLQLLPITKNCKIFDLI